MAKKYRCWACHRSILADHWDAHVGTLTHRNNVQAQDQAKAKRGRR